MKTFYTLVLLSFLFPLYTTHPHYRDRIPNGNHVTNWPGVGHLYFGGGGARNPFGRDFSDNGHQWTQILCKLDSDGDGKTNGFELGDPDCIWKIGDQPQRTINITHPGFADDRIGPNSNSSCANKPQDKYEFILEFKNENYTIPKAETTYLCRKFKFPDTQSYHMVQFIPVIDNSKILHHMQLTNCHSEPRIEDDNSCNFDGDCNAAVWGWAPGLGDFCLPPEAGFLVGNDIKYAVLQIHYHNPNLLESEMDSSGVKIVLTPNLRNNSAGMLTISVDLPDIQIPPESPAHPVSGGCPSVCTSKWSRSITVFSTALHAHKRVRKIWTEWYRNGRYIGNLSRSDDYDFNQQRFDQSFEPKVLEPGDSFKVVCIYNSVGINKTTFGGIGTDDEMCVSVVVYYPELENCKYCASINRPSLRDGRPTASCDGLVDVSTGNQLPSCSLKVDWVRYRNVALNDILPRCVAEGPGCNSECRSLMYQWIKNNTCIERLGFQDLLTNNCEDFKDQCDRFRDVFESCDGLCAIGMDTVHCKENGKCVEYECYFNTSSPTGFHLGVIVGIFLTVIGALLFEMTWFRKRNSAQPEYALATLEDPNL